MTTSGAWSSPPPGSRRTGATPATPRRCWPTCSTARTRRRRTSRRTSRARLTRCWRAPRPPPCRRLAAVGHGRRALQPGRHTSRPLPGAQGRARCQVRRLHPAEGEPASSTRATSSRSAPSCPASTAVAPPGRAQASGAASSSARAWSGRGCRHSSTSGTSSTSGRCSTWSRVRRDPLRHRAGRPQVLEPGDRHLPRPAHDRSLRSRSRQVPHRLRQGRHPRCRQHGGRQGRQRRRRRRRDPLHGRAVQPRVRRVQLRLRAPLRERVRGLRAARGLDSGDHEVQRSAADGLGDDLPGDPSPSSRLELGGGAEAAAMLGARCRRGHRPHRRSPCRPARRRCRLRACTTHCARSSPF